ncbi:MAG: hypothetical protein LBQ15_02825 [Clostridium sp.]|jgi:pilus assembly protein CpaB|nr:hypothetical protein [Clostridium sp.]
MKKILRNRSVLGLLCILAAGGICLGLAPPWRRLLAQETYVIEAVEYIRAGEQIQGGQIRRAPAGGYRPAQACATQSGQAVGQYARSDLYPGDLCLLEKLSPVPLAENGVLGGLDGSQVAVSFTVLSFAAGLSDKLEAGDIVCLAAGVAGEEAAVLPELACLRLIAVTSQEAGDVDYSRRPLPEEGWEHTATLSVLADPMQARLIVSLEQNARIHVLLIWRGEGGERLLAGQEDVLEKIRSGELPASGLSSLTAAGRPKAPEAAPEAPQALPPQMPETDSAAAREGGG